MSRIDRTGLSNVLGLLMPSPASRVARNTGQATDAIATGVGTAARDIEALRARLRQRLRRLFSESADFEALAPSVVVREIMIWEFGDAILNHASFNQVVGEITLAIAPADGVGRKLKDLIASLIAG